MAKLIKKDQGHSWEMEIPTDRIISVTPYNGVTVEATINWSGEAQTIKCEKVIF